METDGTPLEFLEWKTSAPRTACGHHSVVEFDREVVAVKPRWLNVAQVDGVECLADSGADFAVSPAFQGRGLGRLLNDFEDQADRPRGAISVELRPRNELVLHMHKPAKSRELRVWVRPLTARSYLATHVRAGRLPQLRRVMTRSVVDRIRPRARTTDAPSAVELARFDRRADALWAAVSDSFDFARVRDAAFMNWRYADRRGGRRTIVGALDDDQALAYAVFRSAGRVLELSDLLVHPAHPPAGIEVLRRGVALGRERGAQAIVAWMAPRHPDERAPVETGFVATRSTMQVEYKTPRGVPDSELVAQVLRPDLRVHVTMGDFDFA